MPPNLPFEIIEKITSHLSAKELYYVSTVCKSWNKSVTRQLYRSVDIYALCQYELFINSLECNRRIHSQLDSNGYQVRRLILHTCDIMLDDTQVETLKILCPMINEFDYDPAISLTDEHLCYFIPGWKHLTRLPKWHEDKYEDWIPTLGDQLTRIDCYFEELAFLPSFIKPTPLFPCLVELKLSLSYVGPPFTISWMEMLHDQCPSLIYLDVKFTDYDVGGADMTNWKPVNNLRTLKWRIDTLVDPIWYTYLSRKYPNVRELELNIGIDDYFDSFPSPNNRETAEHMRIAHSDSIFHMITNFHQLTTFSILLESKQPSYLIWYPLSKLSIWLGSPAAKTITKLFWRTATNYNGSAFGINEYDDDHGGESGHTMVAVDKLDPLGNIKVLHGLSYDVPTKLAEGIKNLCAGTLMLENLTSLELFFGRNYSDTETWEHLDMNMILDGCPHLNTLGLLGVNFAVEGVLPASRQNQHHHQRQQHWRLKHLRLHHAIINDDDYLENVLKRCPNVSTLTLLDCRIYQRHILQRRQPQHSTESDNNSKPHNVKSYTIHIPDHSLSLVDIGALRLMTFADAPRGYFFETLEVTQSGSRAIFSGQQGAVFDIDGNNRYVVALDCRYVDRVKFI